MKFILSIVLTGLLAFIGGLWLPFWSVAIAGFITALLLFQPPGKAFLGSCIGVMILWGALAWWIDMQNQGLLSRKIALILPLSGNSFLLILLTALVGGIVSGFGAVTGCLLRNAGNNESRYHF